MDASVPDKFRFPFEPYDIQLDFMKNLYSCLEQGKLGIFESPTGTGKSLSLICGSLTWLEDHESKKKTELEKELAQLKITSASSDDPKISSNEPTWFTQAKENITNEKMQNSVKQKLENILLEEEKINKLKERVKAVKLSLTEENKLAGNTKPNSWNKDKHQMKMDSEEDDLIIDEFRSDESDSDDEEHSKQSPTCEEKTKIIFASRTHSQISQFVKEVVKSPFGKQVRVSTLASRAQLCINEDVLKLKNNSLINERCLDMQKKKESTTAKSTEGRPIKKSKSKSSSSCPFMNSQRVQEIRDLSLVEIGDIENLTKTSRQHKACPYYAARSALSDAQLIVLPYATLLHKSTREACGLNLRNSVVIIDEAHNLLETISSIHNVSITGAQISLAHFQLSQYQQKFSTRLSSRNLLHIKQLLFFLSCLLKALGISMKSKNSSLDSCIQQTEEKVFDPINFSVEVGFDHLNMHKLVEFCEKSKLPQKLAGFQPTVAPEVSPLGGLTSFLDKIKPKEAIIPNDTTPPQTIEENTGRSPLMTIVDFMRNLRNTSGDGRVLVVKKTSSSKSFFKYLLLNPAALFREFVTEPRSVVVAGGTMQPHYEFKYSLFVASGADQERIITFSCGHIIPPNHVLPLVLTRGSTNKELDFSWSNRSNLLDELYSLILNMIQVVSGGVVVFLPSYDFEQQVMDHFEKNNYITKIESRKKLFREPKKANEVDTVLADYSQCIRMSKNNSGTAGKNGAFLLCVIGGKLSEGINFSDDLARCVIVVGLPYANIKSAELKEKMDYLNSTTMNLRPEGETRLPGQLYYESLCFKAVNQSIGRAIRHREDYAVLILADARYSRPGSKSSLPDWIARELAVCQKFGPSVALVRKFLTERQKSSNVEKN